MQNRGYNRAYQIDIFNEPVVDYFGNPYILYHNAETDNYHNRVTVIQTYDGQDFRMVHHSKPQQKLQRVTIYGGRNKFFKARWFKTTNTNETTDNFIEAYRIGIRWLKEENNDIEIYEISGIEEKLDSLDDDYPGLIEKLDHIQDYEPCRVIVTMLNYVMLHNLWDSKETVVYSTYNYDVSSKPANEPMKELIDKINS